MSTADKNDLRNIYDLQTERRIALFNIVHEEKSAIQIAKQRELSAWELLSGLSLTAILTFAAQTTKNRLLAIPIAPLIMWSGYRFDQCFCQNAKTIKQHAEKILESKEGKCQLKFIGPPITLHELDERRRKKSDLANSVQKLKLIE